MRARIAVLAATLTLLGAGEITTGGAAPLVRSSDLRMEVGFVSEPPEIGYFSFYVFNDGPDEATNVVVSMATPLGADLRKVSGIAPDKDAIRVESPVFNARGQVLFRFGNVPAGLAVSAAIEIYTPAAPGEVVAVEATVTCDGDDQTENNRLILAHTIPEPPLVTMIRARENPFRLEIEGSHLPGGSFSGHVYIGHSNPGDGVQAQVEALPGKIIITAPQLKKRFPKGLEVPMYLTNAAGGQTRVTFVRR